MAIMFYVNFSISITKKGFIFHLNFPSRMNYERLYRQVLQKRKNLLPRTVRKRKIHIQFYSRFSSFNQMNYLWHKRIKYLKGNSESSKIFPSMSMNFLFIISIYVFVMIAYCLKCRNTCYMLYTSASIMFCLYLKSHDFFMPPSFITFSFPLMLKKQLQ